MLTDDAEKRCVAFGERLLRIDQVEHRVGGREKLQGGAAVRGIDRSEPGRIRDDEAAFEKRRVGLDDDAHRRVAFVFGRVVHRPDVAAADRDETVQAVERNALRPPVFEDCGRFIRRAVFELGDRGGRGIDIDGEQADETLAVRRLLVAKLSQQRIEQKRLSAREFADDREHERVALQSFADRAHALAPRFAERLFDDEQTRDEIVARLLVPAHRIGIDS